MISRLSLAQWVHRSMNGGAREAYRMLQKAQQFSKEEFHAFRTAAWKEQVAFVYDNIPYYRRVMDEKGITPADVQTLEDVRLFPVLTKDIIRAEYKNLRPANWEQAGFKRRRSGGTTGEPIESLADSKASALETYSFFIGLQWMGWKPGMTRIILGGGSLGQTKLTLKARLRNWATEDFFLPAFELDESNFGQYYQQIKRQGPSIILGYASALKYLADLFHKGGIKPTNIKQVFSTAETMPRDWAEFIKEALGAEVKSFYGCGEINSLGYQLEPEGPYIVPDEHVLLESYQPWEGDPWNHSAVQPTSLLGTTLFNRAQPLIRYQNGDMAELAAPGTVHPTRHAIVKLLGRLADLFEMPDGSKISSSFGPHLIFVTNTPVRKYQFIQWAVGKVEFRYAPNAAEDLTDEKKATLKELLHEYLTPQTELIFTRTESFFKSKSSGKHRIMLNMVGEERHEP